MRRICSILGQKRAFLMWTPFFGHRGTQMLIYGNCFKQLPSLNNILLGLNIRLWNVILSGCNMPRYTHKCR